MLTWQAEFGDSPFKQVRKLVVMEARRVFCRHSNEVSQERSHLAFALSQPMQQTL